MSKSSKNHYTPENIGEQKGEMSPFFHAYDTQKLKEILLRSQSNLSFSDEDSIREFSTFFHEEARKNFLKSASESAKKRTAQAERLADLTQELANAVLQLANIISPSTKQENDLITASVSRILCASGLLDKISTNILLFIHKTAPTDKEKNTFFQIEQKLFFLEQAEAHLKISPQNAVQRRNSLLVYPPITIAEHISFASKNYENAIRFSRQATIDSTKAAKQKLGAKYNNILHNAATHLHDIARLLENAEKDLRAKNSEL